MQEMNNEPNEPTVKAVENQEQMTSLLNAATKVTLPPEGTRLTSGEAFTKEGEDDLGDVPMTFPQKLMNLLSKEEHHDVINWLPHGKGFVVLKKKQFANEILPRYFKQAKYTSFTRKLNRWGFQRVTRGPETGAYYHKCFQRGEPRLCLQMSCNAPKHLLAPLKGGYGGAASPMGDPNILRAQLAQLQQQQMFLQHMAMQQQQQFQAAEVLRQQQAAMKNGEGGEQDKKDEQMDNKTTTTTAPPLPVMNPYLQSLVAPTALDPSALAQVQALAQAWGQHQAQALMPQAPPATSTTETTTQEEGTTDEGVTKTFAA